MDVLSIGIAGAGVFGSYHADKFASLDSVKVAAFYDRDRTRAEALAHRHGALVSTDFEAFLGSIDVAVIATPAKSHFELAHAALQRGCHVYVEKPLADTWEDACALLELASRQQRHLVVGHQERHVLRDLGFFEVMPNATACIINRCSNGAGRSGDVSVVFDLMIHDLDAVCIALGEVPRILTTSGEVRDGRVNRASVVMEGSEGLIIRISADRSSARATRTVDVVAQDGATRIDLARRSSTSTSAPDEASSHSSIRSKISSVRDPLESSVRGFVDLIRGRASPAAGITGPCESALSAVKLAAEIDRAITDAVAGKIAA